MRNLFFLISSILFLSIASHYVSAQQQNKIDSLLTLLKELPQDTNRVYVYHRLSYIYNFVQYKTELARQYVDSAMTLSDKLNFQKGIIESHYNYGMVDMNEDKYPEALEHFDRYIKYYTQKGDSLSVGRALYCVGIIHNKLGESNVNLAIQLRILAIYEQQGDRRQMAHTLNSIAGAYWQTQRYNEAIATYNKAIDIYEALNLHSRYGMAVQNLANVYVSKKSYDSAKLFYQQALNIIKEHGSNAEITYILGNMGDLYEELGDYSQALSYNLQSLEIRRNLPSQKRALADILLDVGHMYSILKQYPSAEKFLTEGLLLAEAIRAKDLIQRGNMDLSALYAAQKDFKKAYEHEKISNQWKDSIFNETNSKQLSEFQTKYETSEKDKQIALLGKEKELQEKETQRQLTLKRAFIFGFVLIAILAGLAMYAFRQRLSLIKKTNEVTEANMKHQLSELEMKALRAQINPHFLFNCLNSINRMIVKGENENASLYLKKFSKLVRLIVENGETSRVSLDNELTLIESYIQLEELRFKGRIDYEISVDKNIERENTFLPPMVLQPFVENAIWHGLMHKENAEQGQIKIAVKETDDLLICIIEDNGVGRTRSAVLKDTNDGKTKSVGIKITEERLKLLSRERLKELIKIVDLKDVSNSAAGTRVEINIPLA